MSIGEVEVTRLLTALQVDRRAFLGSLAGGAALALVDVRRLLAASPVPLAGKPIVAQVRHKDSVAWDFRTGWYGEAVDQALVDVMLDRAILELTQAADVAAAWRALLPGYASGKKVAIKVNFNCATTCAETDNQIDGLAEPVNAVVRGLEAAGVVADDIWIYDAVRVLPDRFLRRLRSREVQTFARSTSCGSRLARFSGTAANSVVQFSRSGVPAQILTDVVVDADYLINMPITKQHGYAGLTLSYKNHFGTIQNCSQLHPWTFLSGSSFSTAWNPLVEIMANPHVGAKTVLIVADCLFGAVATQADVPQAWQTFGGRSPATLLVARDPVALDCVQRDILFAERLGDSRGEAYLKLAGGVGQGIYEATPSSSGYQLIDHRRIDMDGAGWFRSYGTGKAGEGGRVPAWRSTGVPAPGNTVVLDIVRGRPQSWAIIALGRTRASLALPFGTLLVDPVAVVFTARLDDSGVARIPLPIPSGPGVVGSEFTLQAFAIDPAAAQGMSHTEGLHLRIGAAV